MCEIAIVTICDAAYLVPTLSAAMSARANIHKVEVAVIIYALGEEPEWASQFQKDLSSLAIQVKWISLPGLSDLSKYHRDRYLPPITLARFWLTEILPQHIKRFLYIDGDVMVDNNLDELLSFVPPVGRIVAAPDNLQLFVNELSWSGRNDIEYLASISVDRSKYFNAGVIYTLRETWADAAPRAMAFMKSNAELCRSSDQSAINHVCAHSAILISQRYNFQSEHMMIMEKESRALEPFIYHFTGGPKPWVKADWPWEEYFNRYYREAELIGSKYGVISGSPPAIQTLAGTRHRQRFKFRQRFFYPWRKKFRSQQLRKLI
ncbi:glycosyltransferase family 8 protein [Methylobacterium pseudosasicola]|uniref:Lipopolysaccharide biosynthesis protein, LPS:glycosyltransferase n=1 Tax=Methylobacterium pseudosasicola TaxID=582667 RepID=A0A1I4VBU0_9HYPH|nr:glycosyltransferase [Methylobacterium pseudosasicola]SFM98648.1 Lipopolysaccharide biosynthesis protein, LPS:glycosyltransferase [Methylobacterium pseudosasicola]